MRYIRTKDGIYDTSTMSISSIYDNGVFMKNVSYCKRIDDFTLLNIYEDDIIKQADTIEELCDEFVVIEDRPIITKLGWLDFQEHKNDLIGQKVYGAIWTDKGLIYVAKIDKNGVLKLL